MGTFSVSAATVTVDDDGRVLMMRRADSGEWQIPGGVLEPGEQPTQGAVRETLEETGVLVDVIRCTGVYTHTVRGIVAFVFLALPVAGEPAVTSEAVEVCWMDADEAMERCSAVFRPRIADSLAGKPAARFRAHDGVNVLG